MADSAAPVEADEASSLYQLVVVGQQELARKILRRATATFVATFLVVGIGTAVGDVIGALTRSTQVTNTGVQGHRSSCEEKASRDLALDLKFLVDAPPGISRADFDAGIIIPSAKC